MATSFSWNSADRAREALCVTSSEDSDVCSMFPKCDWFPGTCKDGNHSYSAEDGSVSGPVYVPERDKEVEQPTNPLPSPPKAPISLKRKVPYKLEIIIISDDEDDAS